MMTEMDGDERIAQLYTRSHMSNSTVLYHSIRSYLIFVKRTLPGYLPFSILIYLSIYLSIYLLSLPSVCLSIHPSKVNGRDE